MATLPDLPDDKATLLDWLKSPPQPFDQSCVVSELLLRKRRFDVVLRAVEEGVVPLDLQIDMKTPGGTRVQLIAVAARAGATNLLRALIFDFAMDPNAKSGDMKGTALHMAITAGNEEASLFLTNDVPGINVNARDIIDRTPLMLAAEMGMTAVLRALVAKGADLSLEADFSGDTALVWSMRWGQNEEAGLCLLELGAGSDGDARRCVEEYLLIDRRGMYRLLRALIRSALAQDEHYIERMNELAHGALTNRIDVFKILVEEMGVDAASQLQFDHPDGTVFTMGLLHLACSKGSAEAAACLIDNGWGMLEPNSDGLMPHHWAAARGQTALLDWIFTRFPSFPVDAEGVGGVEGVTAIFMAAANGHTETVQCLIDFGADPTIPNRNGLTPLDRAHHRGHVACVALLEAAIAEPQRPRALLKARALADAATTIPRVVQDARNKNLSNLAHQRVVLAAAPAYLKGRVAWGGRLPRVEVRAAEEGNAQDEKLIACLKYALGLAYGGGVHFEGEEKPVGMLHEVFVELCEMLVPKWDRAFV